MVENSQIGQRVDDVVSLAYWNPGGRIYGRRGTVLPQERERYRHIVQLLQINYRYFSRAGRTRTCFLEVNLPITSGVSDPGV